jgi:hypothetical protein
VRILLTLIQRPTTNSRLQFLCVLDSGTLIRVVLVATTTMAPNNKKKSSSKKKSSNNNASRQHGGVAGELEETREFYSKPTEHRKLPTRNPDGVLLKSAVLGVSKPSATAKRFVQAYQLVDCMEANADILGVRYGARGDDTRVDDVNIGELKNDVIYMKQCVSLIQALSLTDFRTSISGVIFQNFPLPTCWCQFTTLAPMEGKDSQIQLGKLDAKSFVVLLASAISLAMTTSPRYALPILHELRMQAESNFAEIEWENLESIQVESVATKPNETSLRFALSMVGIKMARQLYRQREERQYNPNVKPVSSKFLLNSVETFARDQCKFRPTCGAGYRILGWIAMQSVATRGVNPLEGAAEMLALMKQCFAIADAEDDDLLKAVARIEAAMCIVYGGGGIVEYRDREGQAQRDLRSDNSRMSAQQVGNVTFDSLRVFGATDEIRHACLEYEKRRMSSGVPSTTLGPRERWIIPRWEVLKLWNEAMSAYDSIKRWGHECFVYNEVSGWGLVVDFLQRTEHLEIGHYAMAGVVPGFPVVRDKGKRDDEESYCTGCAFCGKIDCISIMKCSRCKSASYCSRECQKGDWKNHKAVCELLKK